METLNKQERCKDCNTPMIEARKAGVPGPILVCKFCGTTKKIELPAEEPSAHVPPERWENAPWWLEDYLRRQVDWSTGAFGPGDRTEGVMKHMESEIAEVRAAEFGSPERLVELADLWILALDAVWRNGYTAQQFFRALEDKQAKNIKRDWGPWQPLDTPAFHVRAPEEGPKVHGIPVVEDPRVSEGSFILAPAETADQLLEGGTSTGRVSANLENTSGAVREEPAYSPGQQYEAEDRGIMPFGPVTVTCFHCKHENHGARFSMVAECGNCAQPCGLMHVPLGVKEVTYTREGGAWKDAFGRPVQPCLAINTPAEFRDVGSCRPWDYPRPLFRSIHWGGTGNAAMEMMRCPKPGEQWTHWKKKSVWIDSVSQDPDISEHYLAAFLVTYTEHDGKKWTRNLENFLGRAVPSAYGPTVQRFRPADGIMHS